MCNRARYILFLLTVWLSWAGPSNAAPEIPKLKPLEVRQKPGDPDNKLPTNGNEKNLGNSVADGVDNIVRKKGFELWGDPWMMQGIPLVFPSPETGFNLGLRVQVQDIKRQDPHKLEVEAQILASDQGRYKHHLKVDVPHAFNDLFRLTARIAYDRDIGLRYFGIGNDTAADPAHTDLNDPLYGNVRAGPSFSLQLLRHFGKYVRMGPIFGLKWVDVSAPVGSLLSRQRPIGISGGKTHYIGIGIVHDTLDFEPYPSRGGTNELYFKYHGPATGSNYNFWRATYTYTRFTLLHRKLILAHRTLFEVLSGDVPYYELGAVGGSRDALAFGGDRYLRGYQENRFIDNIRLVFGWELRWDPLFFPFARQDVTIGFVPFVDLGRVWHSITPIEADRWHASGGWGVRIIWNSRLIIRGDFAVNNEGTSFYFNLGNAF